MTAAAPTLEASFPVPVFETANSAGPGKVGVDPADIEFVQNRLSVYESKFEHWLELSEMVQEETLAQEFSALEAECVQKLEHILTGYSILLETMRQSEGVTIDKSTMVNPNEMQQLDIAFLESRCGELLTMEISPQLEFIPAAPQIPSFDDAQARIATNLEQGNYQDILLAYGRLGLDYPGREPSLPTRLNYGLALQYTGQVEAAARYFKNMLDSGELAIGPLSLQREIADLLLAGGDVAAAAAYYDSFIMGYEALGEEKAWAVEQLAFLRGVDPGSEEMIAYMKLLRLFRMYDYKMDAPRLNGAINAFASENAGSPVAVSALRLKTFAVAGLKSWFSRQMVTINDLVAEKKYPEATAMLKSMTRYYLPAELQAVMQKTYYEVAQAEMLEQETQRRLQEIELTAQWDAAVNLLDSQHYDNAIAAFEALQGTDYEDRAKTKIQEAADLAASQMRKEAASLFIKAGKTQDFDQKKELLLASHRLLTEILARYPQSGLLDKVQQNIIILEEQIQRFDPELLQELRENPVELPAESSEPVTKQMQ